MTQSGAVTYQEEYQDESVPKAAASPPSATGKGSPNSLPIPSSPADQAGGPTAPKQESTPVSADDIDQVLKDLTYPGSTPLQRLHAVERLAAMGKAAALHKEIIRVIADTDPDPRVRARAAKLLEAL